MSDLTLDKIFEIDGGERYFLSVYPQLAECFKDTRKKVKLRDDDKTASAGVFRHKKAGMWMLNDFGGGAEDKAITAYQLCMNVNRADAGEAFKILAAFYGFDLKGAAPRAEYSSRLPKPGELPGQVVNLVFKELDYAEALTILSKYAWEAIEWGGLRAKNDEERLEYARNLFRYYHFRVLHSYEKVKSDGSVVHIYTATKEFPMFAIEETGEEGLFYKIYKPKAEKAFRFLWVGKKPEHFMHGLKQHKALIDANIEKNAQNKADAEQHSAAAAEAESKKERLPEKFKEILHVSGGSDALNVAALGYRVIWPNSETAKLQNDTLKLIYKLCYNFYNVPDIDPTGRAAANELAWNHIDIMTVWLPAELAKRSDGKGGFCKDVRDYLRYYKADGFKKLVNNALPFRFWDEMPKYDKDGEQVFKFGRPVYLYEFNNVRGYNFLQMNGFWRIADDKYKEGYRLIKIDGNIVRDVNPNEVKYYIHRFLKERQMPEDLRNVMYRTPQLGEGSLSNLDEIEPDFKHYSPEYQYLFFENKTWKVTAAGIEAVKMPGIYVWEKKILKPKTQRGFVEDFKPEILPSFFTVAKDGENWLVDFKSMDCDYMKFTLQTCRIHWRTELEHRMEFFELTDKEKANYLTEQGLPEDFEQKMMLMASADNQEAYKKKYQFRLDGSLLTEKERNEQALAFVNRVFLIGYLLHRYKDPTKPWSGFAMDYRISEEGASNGRAGKGLLALALKTMLPMHYWRDARDPGLFEDKYLWGGVERGNDLIHLEDWNEYLDFERLFNVLSGSLPVNPKGLQGVTYEYADYGKILIDTNFADRYMSGSAKGRKLWTVFADFYHEDLEYYREVRTPQTELGRRMFDGWDATEWNRFYNFMAQCLQFYLSLADKAVKIDPPFANIIKRNSLSLMGENFRQWADTYFDSRLNEAIERKIAYEDFVKNANSQKSTPQGFFKKLIAWTEFMNYKFNPPHVQGWTKAGEGKKYGYIKRSQPVQGQQGKYTTVEYIYIETSGATPEVEKITDDMPF